MTKQRTTIRLHVEGGGEREIDLFLITEFGSMMAAPQSFFDATRPGEPMIHLSGKRNYYVRIRPYGDYIFITKESLHEVADAMRREEYETKEGRT